MIRLKELIEEKSNGVWKWFKGQLPNWPDYVIKDMFFVKIRSKEDLRDMKFRIDSIKKEWEGVRWEFKKLRIKFDIFDKDTRDTILRRGMGEINPDQIPNDEKRHKVQSDLIKKRGISKQPIIVIKKKDEVGYTLIEGWHRTIQHIKHYPEGYDCPVWIGNL